MAYTDTEIKAGIDQLIAQGYSAEQIVQVAVEKGVDPGQLAQVGRSYSSSWDEQAALEDAISTAYGTPLPAQYVSNSAPAPNLIATGYGQGVNPQTEYIVSTMYPEYAQLSDAGKTQFWADFMALPEADRASLEQQTLANFQTYQASQGDAQLAQVVDMARNLLGRDPTPEELQDVRDHFARGGTVEQVYEKIQTLPEYKKTTQSQSAFDAMRYGLDQYMPTYGTTVGGLNLPGAPTINTLKGMAQYGQTAGGVTGGDIRSFVNQYGLNSTEVQQAMQQYGITQEELQNAMASTDPNLRYGGYDAVRYGDVLGKTFTPQEMQAYVNQYGIDSPEVQQAMQQYGITQAELQNALVNTDPNMTFGGRRPGDYAVDVADPMSQWQYETSPAFTAKQQLMSQDINNRLASRGIRGTTSVNMLEDQTRKLVSEDYTNERNWEFQQLLQKYQNSGMEYDKAYQAAQGEYGMALTSQNQLAQQGTTDALQNYQMNLAQYQDMYNKRAQEAASAYDKIINEIKIGQNAAGTISSAGTNLANQTSQALGTAGQAASTSALQSGIASAGLYSGLGQLGSNLLGSSSTQQTLGNLFSGASTGTTGYLGG